MSKSTRVFHKDVAGTPICLKHVQKYFGLGIQFDSSTVNNLNFTGDQVILAGDREDDLYMLRNIHEEYSNCRN